METLIVQRDQHAVWVTLNRPGRKNALNWTMLEELGQVGADIRASDGEDRVVVLTGAGDAFCAGADLSESDSFDPGDAMRAANGIAAAWYELPIPVIAAVNGVAAGAGLGLVAMSDVVLAVPDSRFVFSWVTRGLAVDFGASWLLPRIIGLGAARGKALSGASMDAGEAHRLGLVGEVVEASQLARRAGLLAERLAASAPLAVAATKRLVNQSADITFREALEREAAEQASLIGSADFKEGLSAFFEKRRPVFAGR